MRRPSRGNDASPGCQDGAQHREIGSEFGPNSGLRTRNRKLAKDSLLTTDVFSGLLGQTVNEAGSQIIVAKKRQQSVRTASRRNKPGWMNDTKRREFFNKYLFYLDGLALYADAECPEDQRRGSIQMGWGMGRQIISQYVVEMLLQARLVHLSVRRTETHNLARLYRRLPQEDRDRVEGVYKRLLNAEAQWTWDVYETVTSFLDFLGTNPHQEREIPLAAEARRHTVLPIQLQGARLRPLHRSARLPYPGLAG